MGFYQEGLQRIVEGQGMALAIMGMGIVFTSLVIITVITSLMPYVLVVLAKIFPEKEEVIIKKTSVKKLSDDDSNVVAAISLALHQNMK